MFKAITEQLFKRRTKVSDPNDLTAGTEFLEKGILGLTNISSETPERQQQISEQAIANFTAALQCKQSTRDTVCAKAFLGSLLCEKGVQGGGASKALENGIYSVPILKSSCDLLEEAITIDRKTGREFFRDPLQRASFIDGNASTLWMAHARFLKEQQGPKGALEYLMSRVGLVDDIPSYWPVSWFEIGFCHHELGQNALAIEDFQKVISSNTASLVEDGGKWATLIEKARKMVALLSEDVGSSGKSGCLVMLVSMVGLGTFLLAFMSRVG